MPDDPSLFAPRSRRPPARGATRGGNVATAPASPLLRAMTGPDGRDVTVRIEVNPRAHRISVRIDPATRHIVAIAPSPRLTEQALAFAQSRIGWACAQLAKLPRPITLAPGETIPLQGASCRLIHITGRGAPRFEDGALLMPAPTEDVFEGRVRRFLHQEAKRALVARVAVHAATLGVTPSRISVKDTSSRWGSASSRGALNFSWRVILAPPFVLDYLAAHEVAHLREMNHSARFWTLVAQCIPDYARAEAWLDRHGGALHAVDPKR